MTPHLEYNAAFLFYQGDRDKISRALRRHGSWPAVWRAAQSEARFDATREFERLERNGIRLMLREDSAYPDLLREIPDPPHALYVLGDVSCAGSALAIVGTRRATMNGCRTARNFSAALAERGITIVSGLAFGIDREAHCGALEARGRTIAVLPAGLDLIYPVSHEGLAKKILEGGGALVSEYPLSTPPLPFRFLERNRIVSGLSHATLVVEAPLRSGALVTARYAIEQNRDVFAVPGSITGPNHAGCHALIRDGAGLAAAPEDLFGSLGIADDLLPRAQPQNRADMGQSERIILNALRNAGSPASIDTLGELTKLEIHVVSGAIALLLVHGMIIETDCGYSLA